MKKLYEVVAKVGEYQKDGETKAKWQTVGAMLEGEKGPFILLAKWFNPAGLVDAKGGENVMLSLFPPKERESA
jgi:single-strand DNA-binding protein